MSSEQFKLRADALDWREIEGEVMVLDLERSEYLAVNESGATLWPLLAAGASRSELEAALTAKFELEEDTAAADVTGFLASLDDSGLLIRE